ncbi:NAD(P)/FAD-dependent oxidoreductase [Ottowia thiooxydans]|uniref:NAD(P)/FAD-dependent oxidoreductase n=1 Tax=Ottowia thiooxydans TaxID=219182 RepID=UPI0004056AFA|nr:FAD-binding oxidoreductase [Ottowia thiooxydans]
MNSFDIVIIGAGMAGASLAWRLAGRGSSVLLLEREAQPGYHSTGRSAALFMESYGPPQVRALTRASRSFFLHPPLGFTDAQLMHPRGAMHVAMHGQEAALAALHDELIGACPDLQTLDAAQILERVPVLRPDLVASALYDPHAQDMDVDAIHQGFLRGARAGGVILQTGRAPVRAVYERGLWSIQFETGEPVQAARVVNAAGAWADEVASLFGAAPINIEPRRRSAFTFSPPEGVNASTWPAVISVSDGWYLKPDAGQILGSPGNADPVAPHDVQPEELDIAIGIYSIEEATSLTIRRPASTWAGLRSFVADGEMVIGFDDVCPGFFWLAAQGGYGIQSAAGASQLAAALLEERELPRELVEQGVDPAAVSVLRMR